jgi:protein-tyrosine phosphatase
MIDLHCHILPGVDDGALDLEDSLAMARVAAADGIEVIAATPHIRHDHDVQIPQLPARVKELNDAIGRNGIPLQIVTGGEVAETALEGLDQEALRAVSLAGRGWILLEPRPGPLGDSLHVAVHILIDRGFRALIAHPERHPSEDLRERIADLIEDGALVQATAAFFTSGSVREGMRMLAERGLIHVLGSDAHSSHGGRPARLSQGLEALERVEALRPHLNWIAAQAPAAILRGERLEPPFAPSG